MSSEPIKVTELGLMPKTAAILEKNEITTLDELLLLDKVSLNRLEGLSHHRATKVSECVENWRNALVTNVVEDNEKKDEQKQDEPEIDNSIGAYLNDKRGSSRNIEVFVSYFSSPDATLEKVSSGFGITRERVRQICKKCLNNIRNGFNYGQIDSEILNAVDSAAEAKTEISMVDVSDKLLGKEVVTRAIVSAFPERFELIKSQKINGEWLVKKDEDVCNMIDYLSKTLQERDTPMKTEDVLTIFPINEEMLFSIQNVIEKDGYVTLSTNKMVTGRIPKIKNYLLGIGRPASVQEISDGTGLTLNQVRGAISEKNFFENVGNSVYDSVEANYLDLSPSELARNLLIAEDKAISVSRIINYILKYDYDGKSKRDVLIDLFSRDDSSVYHLEGYVLLKEWGEDKIVKPIRRNYAVDLRDAVKNVAMGMDGIFNADSVLEEIKRVYGDTTSNNLNSVKSYLNNLVKNDVIIEIGKNTGCYRRP